MEEYSSNKSILSVMQAYLDGALIETRERGYTIWVFTASPSWDWMSYEFRIKSDAYQVVTGQWIPLIMNTAELKQPWANKPLGLPFIVNGDKLQYLCNSHAEVCDSRTKRAVEILLSYMKGSIVGFAYPYSIYLKAFDKVTDEHIWDFLGNIYVIEGETTNCRVALIGDRAIIANTDEQIMCLGQQKDFKKWLTPVCAYAVPIGRSNK